MTPSLALRVLHVTARTGGSRLAARALPTAIGLGVVAAVLFSKNGLRAADVVALAGTRPAVRVGLWVAWLLATTPAVAALVGDRRAHALRSLPLRPALPSIAAALLVAAVHLPMAALYVRGAGWAEGVSVLGLATALSMLLAARPSTTIEGAAVGALGAAALGGARPAVVAALAPIAAIAVHHALVRGPASPSPELAWIRGPAWMALPLVHHLRLVRAERWAALRAVGLAAAGGALAALLLDNTGRGDARAFVPAVLAVPLVAAAAAIVGPIVASDRALSAALVVAPRSLRLGAALLVAGAWGAGLGAVAFAAGYAGSGLPPSVAPACVLAGASLAGVTLLVVEGRPPSPRRDDAGRLVLLLGGLALAGIVASLHLAELSSLALAGIALAALLRARARTRAVPPSRSDATPLVVEGVAKRFGRREVLCGVDLRVDWGDVAVLRGPNGSGKSTLLRVVAGLVAPDAGAVSVHGASLAADRTTALRDVGWAPERAELPDHLSAREVVRLWVALRGGVEADADLTSVGLEPSAHAKVSALSLGQARRLGLACALAGAPRLLVLDEPTNGLDREGLEVLHASIVRQRARGAVLMASHEDAFVGGLPGVVPRRIEGGRCV